MDRRELDGVLAMAGDVEHYIACHEDTRAAFMRKLAAALVQMAPEYVERGTVEALERAVVEAAKARRNGNTVAMAMGRMSALQAADVRMRLDGLAAAEDEAIDALLAAESAARSGEGEAK